jgi:hypothetical protein
VPARGATGERQSGGRAHAVEILSLLNCGTSTRSEGRPRRRLGMARLKQSPSVCEVQYFTKKLQVSTAFFPQPSATPGSGRRGDLSCLSEPARGSAVPTERFSGVVSICCRAHDVRACWRTRNAGWGCAGVGWGPLLTFLEWSCTMRMVRNAGSSSGLGVLTDVSARAICRAACPPPVQSFTPGRNCRDVPGTDVAGVASFSRAEWPE